ncbi:hypothetical protein GCM10010353_57180 [Streptomyces chryseus]|uniref:Uncharacterized protein n=1 Tax=Streptomyces chryseus TaxID=68186 RepID=A0ABQ3DJS9_9ACTN|nr:hypothetical protein [Streptomyces chryseus]GGX34701.1 hypothetical protein GCM10010353_57180 [Streptomyces chryseus]GHA95316.1 hypothetical protein GCM10010346_17680 [Streptomyces chryseus]
MAGDGVRVDASVLKGEGFHMFEVGQDFALAAKALFEGLNAIEEDSGKTPPWGDEEMGEHFGVVYEGLRDGMKDSMPSLAKRIAGMGLKFTTMGVNHEKHEAEEDAKYAALTSQHEADGGAKVNNFRSV